MQDFAQAIRLGTEPISCSGLGLEVVRMIEAVETSVGRGGARVRLAPLTRRSTLVA
jgi:hypothetical protein